MTDANHNLLTCEPFVRHAAYTLWRLEPHPNDPNKPPVKVPVHYDGRTRHSLGSEAKGIAPNPAPPLSAEQAAGWLAHNVATGVGHARRGEVGYLGVGFRPEGTGLVCIDLDDCIVDGAWTPGAAAVLAMFHGALIEQSVGGSGAHIWVTVQGAGPGRRGQKTTPLGPIEIYGAGQFVACGTVLGGDAGVDHTAAVEQLLAQYWPAPVATDASPLAELTPDQMAAALADTRSALATLDPDNRDEWVSAGQALRSLGDAGYAVWAEWSATSKRFPGGEGLDKWDSFTGERTDYRAIIAKAQRNGWVNPAARAPLPDDAGALFAATTPALSPGPAGMLLEPPASRQVATSADLSFMAAAQGMIAATVASVETALMSPESGIRIGYDTFKDAVCIGLPDQPWRPLRDTDYGRLRAGFERRGFKPVPAETMSTAVAMVAEVNQFDSLKQWVDTLVWDGVPRMAGAMVRYYGAADTPYARAVGEYAFTTLAGRAIEPGVKADMAIIMVGIQGAGKTSALEVLVPEPSSFGEVDLAKDDDVIARKLRGKCLVELAEMRGFKGRDADANKAWISRRVEEWTPKYKEFNTSFPRRCLIIGTANDDEQLDDPTGARRFLPIHVTQVDRAGLTADREQLWAEGAARFRQSGIAWQDAEQLARAEHHKFEVVDELQSVVEAFLAAPPAPVPGEPLITTPRSAHPIRGVDILTTCFGTPLNQVKKAEQMALAKIMKKLGYVRGTFWKDGRAIKMWTRGGEAGGNALSH